MLGCHQLHLVASQVDACVVACHMCHSHVFSWRSFRVRPDFALVSSCPEAGIDFVAPDKHRGDAMAES